MPDEVAIEIESSVPLHRREFHFHGNREERLLTRIEQLEEKLMAAIDDLTTAVANVQAAETSIETTVSQLRAQQGTPDEAIAPLVGQVQAVADSLNALVAPPAA